MKRRAASDPSDGGVASGRSPAAAPSAGEANGRRLPTLILIVALIAGGIWLRPAAKADEGNLGVAEGLPSSEHAPTAPPASAGAATWFCAGGSAAPGGAADHKLVIVNTGLTPASGTVQAFPSNAAAGPTRPIEVPVGGRVEVRLADLVQADFAAALVETQGGAVVVEHELTGASGHELARCSNRGSATWFFPWGQTILGSTLRLALFNPFPGNAVVDITFDTDDGYRSPEDFQALLVPARRLVVVNVDAVVTRRQRVATRIVARSGRLIADLIQTTTAADDKVALSVSPGAPAAASTWYFADGRVDSATLERYVVFNPGDRLAEVELRLLTGATTAAGQSEPFQLQVEAGAAVEVTLNKEPRVPQPLVHGAIVQALGDVPVVAARVLMTGSFATTALAGTSGDTATAPGGAGSPATTTTAPSGGGGARAARAPGVVLADGVSASLGQPLVARQWVLALPTSAQKTGTATQVTVLDPAGAAPVDVTIELVRATGRVVLRQASVEPGRRIEVEVPGNAGTQVVVTAGGPVVVAALSTFAEPIELGSEPAVPFADSAELAEPVS